VTAIAGWRFAPPTRAGRATNVRGRVAANFTLRKSALDVAEK